MCEASGEGVASLACIVLALHVGLINVYRYPCQAYLHHAMQPLRTGSLRREAVLWQLAAYKSAPALPALIVPTHLFNNPPPVADTCEYVYVLYLRKTSAYARGYTSLLPTSRLIDHVTHDALGYWWW